MGAANAVSLAKQEGQIIQLQQKISDLQMEVKMVTMMTERKKRVLEALRTAVAYYGYDMDALMATKCRERTIADLRAIVWTIYQEETKYSTSQLSVDFGWNRCTIFTAVKRAKELRSLDRNFCDIYDSINDAFNNVLIFNNNYYV